MPSWCAKPNIQAGAYKKKSRSVPPAPKPLATRATTHPKGGASEGMGHRRNSHSSTGESTMNHRYERMYQIIASHSAPHALAGGSDNGKTHNSSFHLACMPPTKDIAVTAIPPSSH